MQGTGLSFRSVALRRRFRRPSAEGGTETVIEDGGRLYRVHSFLSGGTLTVTRGGWFEYLVVGGGGAAYHGASANGGGPGGSVKTGALILTAAQLAVTVGSGARSAYSGEPSDVVPATASSFSEITAPPGGFGAGAFDPATEGGGGSVASSLFFPDGAVNTDTGFTGGNSGGTDNSTYGGGGGTGAGGDGESAADGNAGDGGPGVKSSITGEEKGYGGGGGGSHRSSNEQAGSGVDGGGDGVTVGSPGQSGEPNTGGGAGGGYAGSSEDAPTGGSGIVILRYRITEAEYLAEVA